MRFARNDRPFFFGVLPCDPVQPEGYLVKKIIFFLICFFVFSCHGYAATKDAAPKVPTTITSDTMTYDPASKQVSFSGHVYLERVDFKLWAEKLIIYFAEDATKTSAKGATAPAGPGQDLSNVEKIVALEQVRLVSQGKKGFSEKTTYWQKDGLMQMEGNPRLEDGGNKIQGEIIKLYTKDNRSEVIGGKKRVQAIFYSRPDQVK